MIQDAVLQEKGKMLECTNHNLMKQKISKWNRCDQGREARDNTLNISTDVTGTSAVFPYPGWRPHRAAP